jgi:hypothetical protein
MAQQFIHFKIGFRLDLTRHPAYLITTIQLLREHENA